MLSVAILLAGAILALIVGGWAVAKAARMVGSPRGKWSVAVLALICASLANGVLMFLVSMLPEADARTALARQAVLLVVNILVSVLIFSGVFRLSFGRSFAPYGASFAVSLLFLVIAIFVVRPYLAEAFVMPTRSMAPTIEPGDRFVVNKLLHPRRWDLVAYRQMDHYGQSNVYCKRLVGLPGERIRFENGTIYVNDVPTNVPAVLAGRCRATLPGTSHITKYDDGQTITLGSREYFFIGDNIDMSADSRIHGPSTPVPLSA